MTQDPEVDWSEIFGALAHTERRTILRLLTDTPDGSVSIGELAEGLVGEAADDEERENGTLRLWHVHLPKLERSGLVSQTDDTATATPVTAQLPQWVLDPAHSDPSETPRPGDEYTSVEAGGDD